MIGLNKGEYEYGMSSLAAIARRGAEMQAQPGHPTGDIEKDVCAACGFMWIRDAGRPAMRCPHCGSTKWSRRDLVRHSCNMCSHVWLSSSGSPSRCPSCHSRQWSREVAKPVCPDDHPQDLGVIPDGPVDDVTTLCDDEREFIQRVEGFGVDRDEARLMYLIVSGMSLVHIARSTGVSFDMVMRTNAVLGRISSAEGVLRDAAHRPL